MVNPAALALAGEVLKNPQQVGEGVNSAATGIGTGISTASTGIGTGISNAATGIGDGVNRSKMGDAAVVDARGKAQSQYAEALGNADATRIKALATLAEKIKDLPTETQQMILDKAVSVQPQEEAPQVNPLLLAASMAGGVTPTMLLTQQLMNANAYPGTHIRGQNNCGACRQAPAAQYSLGA